MYNGVSILLVGIGGYGEEYVDALLGGEEREDINIAGVVDVNPESSSRYSEIKTKGIPVFSSMEEFYRLRTAQLAILSTPIHLHCRQACIALENGSNVLCEKPLCATMEEVLVMQEACMRADRFVAVGFQMAYSNAVQDLKKDILSGVLGKPARLKTIVSSPRWESYYRRNRWAGRIRDEGGNWIMDSVASNAASHYLHNMLYILGDITAGSAKPANMVAELYRANQIENYDTAAVRLYTESGVEILYYATHAGENYFGPEFCFEFENAEVIYRAAAFEGTRENDPYIGKIVALFHDGNCKVYGNPLENQMNKLWKSIEAAGKDSGIVCGIEAAATHVMCINGMQILEMEIPVFPADLIETVRNQDDTDQRVYVTGLNETLESCYDRWMLPGEEKVGWAKRGRYLKL